MKGEVVVVVGVLGIGDWGLRVGLEDGCCSCVSHPNVDCGFKREKKNRDKSSLVSYAVLAVYQLFMTV